ncbi:glycosyltransferase [Pseudomonas chlororaphis subsp. aurantiaca]|uniref:glycosyltransferase n=1 Tax=Pseudomonas chlororaphis TaxID=587753 RepID=UPI000F57B61C|nr:glycosyltransferase [Pseudomonas chlororaphis]AZD56205.1 Alpha-L-Rha alpha-1,3-L-rhamnosyltransferase [Pseudomonas chlororaphis subsp. aurantiaca]
MFLVSVCIATYNGADFIREQLDSILMQIPQDSEVLIGDDGSTDETIRIIEEVNDSRIEVIKNPSNLGYIRNFESLISKAKGDYIFLSDQDDIWPADRVERMISSMEASNSLLVVGAMEAFVDDVNSRSFFCGFDQTRDASPFKNILDMFAGRSVPYYGCSMLLSKRIKPYLIPFYSSVISHDIWIAFVANRRCSVSHLKDPVTLRRIHGNNLTQSNRSFFEKIKTRYFWLLAILNII